MKKGILCSLLLCLFLGCDNLEIATDNKNEDKVANQSLKKSVINSSEFESNIIYSVVGGDPKKYTVQFQWPVLADNALIRVRLGNVLAEVSSVQTFFTHTVSHNQQLNYSFDILAPDKKLLRTVVKSVLIPSDYVAEKENTILNKNTLINVNRVFLSSDNPIIAGEYSLEINTNELIGNNGEIQTFPENFKDIYLKDDYIPQGRDGNAIFIKSKNLYGRFKVVMRGEEGKKGDTGISHYFRADGRGEMAKGGVIRCDPPSDHGNCGPSGVLCLTSNISCWCHKYGSDGGIGITGSKGFTGGTGKKGGKSGVLRIEIDQFTPVEGVDSSYDPESFRPVIIDIIPGKGGQGGEGGEGQIGSLGGEGRDSSDPQDCRGNEGPIGATGEKGDQGPRGPSGDKGLVCLYIRSENINECN